MKIPLLFLLLVYFLFSCPISYAQETLTLNKALEIALENNYSLYIARNEIQLAESNNTLGNAGFLPTITASGLWDNSVNNVNQKFLDGRVNERNGAKNSNLQGGIELNWTLFDGMRMFASRERLYELESLGKVNLQNRIEQTFARVIRSYFEVVQNTQLHLAYEESVKLSEQRLKLANDKYNVGTFSKTEVLKAEVDLNADKSLLIRQKVILSNSQITLNQILARDINTDFLVEDSLSVNQNLLLEEIKTSAFEKNISIKAMQINKTVNLLSIKELKAEKMPQIDLRTGYNLNRSNSQAGFIATNMTTGFHYGLALTYILYNGSDVKRRINNAKISLSSTEIAIKDTLTRIEQRVVQTYNTYQMNIALLNLENENLKVAERNYDLAREQYNLGAISSLELREAQQNLTNARSRLATVKYEVKLAETELKRLSGTLVADKS